MAKRGTTGELPPGDGRTPSLSEPLDDGSATHPLRVLAVAVGVMIVVAIGGHLVTRQIPRPFYVLVTNNYEQPIQVTVTLAGQVDPTNTGRARSGQEVWIGPMTYRRAMHRAAVALTVTTTDGRPLLRTSVPAGRVYEAGLSGSRWGWRSVWRVLVPDDLTGPPAVGSG